MVHINTVVPNSACPRPQSSPNLGLYVYLIAFCAVIGGFLFGYDTGIVSSAMLYVPKNEAMKPMGKVWQEVIVSVTPGFAALGSLLSGPAADKWGRKKVILVSSFVFTIGGLVCGIAIEKYMLLVGRILLGIAIGISSMVVPMYIGESSPAHIRGQLITGFQLMITFGLLAANVMAGGFSYVDPQNVGWRLMFGFAAIPSAIQFVIFFFLPESPRWLYKAGEKPEAKKVLDRIYSHNAAWINYEMTEISLLCDEEKREMEQLGKSYVISRVLTTAHVRKALIIGCLLQAFQQLSGINTIMYYTGKIIQSSGVGDEHVIVWISVGISSVNFVCTFIPMYLVERVGRRVLLLVSVLGVAITLLLMGGAFYAINRDSAETLSSTLVVNNSPNRCSTFSNCDYCVTDERCGFCQPLGSQKGYCLPTSGSSAISSIGPCSNLTIEITPKFQWSEDYCVSRFTIAPIILMLVYLSFFSSGYAPLPWVMNAEFYPLWARSTCISMATAVNWIFNLIISLTFLSLSEAVSKHGTFLIYAGITFVAMLFVVFFVPETRNYTIEEVETLFMTDRKRKDNEDHKHSSSKPKNSDISQEMHY
ncbi:unnamed protein product [Caenorhabditis auriculariae]|uniref:Major facilitator superfamily (MFS) profile domain-containing protein n=1 Tax=Caenorhabditis auriculariae TaxID=2777116 RepID=A0A8S1H012_9PELO|nr:unnamed protein product [Caenorhabditis auriculariae]